MGFFDVLCSASGIPLRGMTRLVLVAATAPKNDEWVAIALPIADTYNRLGYIDLPNKLDAHAKAIERLCRDLAWDRDIGKPTLETSLSELGRCMNESVWGRSNGRRVSYALFDERVYLALARLGAKRTKLTAKSPGLFEAVIPIGDIRERIYGGLPKPTRGRLRERALELARVLAFPTKLAPVDITAGGQLTGYSKKQNPYGAAEPYFQKAKKKWAKHREVMAAIAWHE